MLILARGFGDFLVVERGLTFVVGFRVFVLGLTRASEGFRTLVFGFTYFLSVVRVFGFFLVTVLGLASPLLGLSFIPLIAGLVLPETTRPSLSLIVRLFFVSVRSKTTGLLSPRRPSREIRLAVSVTPPRGFLSTTRLVRRSNGL